MAIVKKISVSFLVILIVQLLSIQVMAEESTAEGSIPVLELEIDSRGETDQFAATVEGTTKTLAKGELINLNGNHDYTTKKDDICLKLEQKSELLGVGESDTYLLLGGAKDKSLIRNYLGYRIAQKTNEDAPQIRLVELVIQQGKKESYQGVYLLVEKKNEIDKLEFEQGESPIGLEIETYRTQNYEEDGELALSPILGKEWKQEYEEYISRLSYGEQVLYSDNYKVFYEYKEMFDVTSFIDSFIIEELMSNYGEIKSGNYGYSLETEKITSEPLWRFDEAIDNERVPFELEVDEEDADAEEEELLPFTRSGYYEQFFKSPEFIRSMQERYHELRDKGLTEKWLEQQVESAAEQVSEAKDRDWERWNDYKGHVLQPLEVENGAGESVLLSRQTEDYDAEILKIKTNLRNKNLDMGIGFANFDFSDQAVSHEVVLNSNPIWLLVFLVAFFLLIRFVRKYGV
ncbi:hypothetical protein M2454_000278 [Aequitasia blattaphilus]|uniref:CotH kinase family protein n=1 Tax=Aequitasia blattaphilus TaxID=2949332 RepID=A0ABT1E5E7_9FIRM|nr:CotH kinase family protein [Aequitasia blattaphilus]MCP1101056.1 CotH kinase family protein [Aequitasia blattaphilus]MCR8613696.1 CotH kinase family protein [Aequitasia blattaphilus]